MKHRSHSKNHLSMACKPLMSDLGHSGLKPSQIKKVVNVMKAPNVVDVTVKQCSDMMPHISIRDPHGVTVTKGCPKIATRIKSSFEVYMNAKEKKQRRCSNCHVLGHYTTGCPKKGGQRCIGSMRCQM